MLCRIVRMFLVFERLWMCRARRVRSWCAVHGVSIASHRGRE